MNAIVELKQELESLTKMVSDLMIALAAATIINAVFNTYTLLQGEKMVDKMSAATLALKPSAEPPNDGLVVAA